MSHDPSSISRPSACPALARIVAARDGGLCRIKLPGGELRAEQATAIAHAADQHAGGMLELTNRANVQLRGVVAGHEPALIASLLDAGLGPRLREQPGTDELAAAGQSTEARRAAADDVRNVMTSPLAGRDIATIIDTRPLAAELLTMLQNEPRFGTLSPKFAILLDGGERLAPLDHPHDVWLSAMRPDGGAPEFAVGLAGEPSNTRGCALGAVPAIDAAALVRALLDAFLDLAGPGHTRMRDVLRMRGAESVLERVAHHLRRPLCRSAALEQWHRAPAEPALRFGAHRQRDANLWYAGAQPPLGRIGSSTLRELARLASLHGNGTLRVTPWQGVLLPDIDEHAIPHVEAGFDTLGFIRDATHPLARLIACAGTSGCAKSHADTKADALRLARSLPAGLEVHLSGCVRSCAAAHCAPHTLLATAPGRYDLYHRLDDERPSNACTADTGAEGRFGERLAAGLTIEEVAERLRSATRGHPAHA